MLLSMTGFGRASQTFHDKTISAEVRSLNSKYTDIRFKLPNNYREKEPALRRLILERAERGKLDVSIDVKSHLGEDEYGINVPLFRKYYRELSALSAELNIPTGDIIQTILRIPNVIASDEDAIDEELWQQVLQVLMAALDNFEQFRAAEGQAIEEDLRLRVGIILEALSQVSPLEIERGERLRQRMRQSLEEYMNKEHVDENRYEQEVLFYLEKIDITEEKVRLEQHCKYFLEQLDNKQSINGRKLSFISQEMGREINTLGAKAYSSDIQRLVVAMKDELEKIKEQVANIV